MLHLATNVSFILLQVIQDYKRCGDTKINIVGDEHGASPQNFYI